MAGADTGLREMAYLEAKPVSHVRIVAEASALCSDDDVGESWKGHGRVMEGSWKGHGRRMQRTCAASTVRGSCRTSVRLGAMAVQKGPGCGEGEGEGEGEVPRVRMFACGPL